MPRWLYNGAVPFDSYQTDFDTVERDALETLAYFQAQPLKDTSSVNEKTKRAQECAWGAWTDFFTAMKRDPNEIILDLCRGKRDAARKKSAIDYCKTFFTEYVKRSEMTLFPTLGPEEYELRRTIDSASSVLKLWGLIVTYADSTLLQQMRRDDGDNKELWRLTFDTVGKRTDGPVYAVSLWISEDLADTFKLSRRQLFKKLEATDEDVICYASTLWESAHLIPCEPDTRLSMHGVLLMGAVGGFRPEEILGIPYKQIELDVVRDPENRERTRLVATITVYRSKRKEKAIRYSQDDVVSFSITSTPYQIIDLVSLIAAVAISHDAFETRFSSIEELLSRPHLEHTDTLPLQWKSEVLESPVFDISYFLYWTLWNRIIHVCGLRESAVPYSLRVGAGGRIDGSLTDSLRNYIMSHSSPMFERSYHPRRVRENLASIAFGDRSGESEARLFSMLRNASLKKDKFAPIDPTPEELQRFEQRRDVSLLRSRYAEAEPKDKGDMRAQLAYLLQILSRLLIRQKREDYFREADRLRALGQHTDSLRSERPEPPSGTAEGGAVAIGRFLDSGRCRGKMELYTTLLISYLRRRPAEVVVLARPASGPANDETYDPGRPRCLLGCGPFFNRGGLTRHIQRFHLNTGTFDRPFACPECLVGSPPQEFLVSCPSDWGDHVRKRHRSMDAPYRSPMEHTPRRPRGTRSKPPKSLACPICERKFRAPAGRRRHVTVTHLKKGYFNNRVFPCPECERVGMEPAQIDSYETFTDHCAEIHDIWIGAINRGWGAKATATPVPAASRPRERTRQAANANKEQQGLSDGSDVSTKRHRRSAGNASTDDGTLCTDLNLMDGNQETGHESASTLLSPSPPDFGKLLRSESAAGDHLPQSEGVPGSRPLPLPPQPPSTAVTLSEMARGVGDYSLDREALWFNADLMANPWLTP